MSCSMLLVVHTHKMPVQVLKTVESQQHLRENGLSQPHSPLIRECTQPFMAGQHSSFPHLHAQRDLSSLVLSNLNHNIIAICHLAAVPE